MWECESFGASVHTHFIFLHLLLSIFDFLPMRVRYSLLILKLCVHTHIHTLDIPSSRYGVLVVGVSQCSRCVT